MGKDLVIVESPSKARTIGRILGNDYTVMASLGHVRDLPAKSLGIDIDNGFQPRYEANSGRRNVLGDLTKAIGDAEHVYLATDPDREGEAIAWHLQEHFKQASDDVTFHRVTFHEITKSAVQHAFDDPAIIDMDRVDAQQARRVLDRLVGYQVSPLLWRRVNNARSAGRVQSVAVRLICEREAAIEAFEPKEYWNLSALFSRPDADAQRFVAKLARVDGEKVDIGDGETAAKLSEIAKSSQYVVSSVKKTPKSKRPSPPFITSTLQQAASANLRMSTSQTMRIAQELYEGIDTGSGPAGLITYMRTDSVNISKDAQAMAKDYIETAFGDAYIPNKPNVFKSKSSAQEAHEAIRPTDVNFTPQQAAKFLSAMQLQLYRLIWNRFVASQMAPAKLLQYSVELDNQPTAGVDHALLFRATATNVVFPGFQKVYDLADVEKEAQEEEQQIPELTESETCVLHKLDSEQKFTEPPPRFSEAMLVRELENNGIGRPSTYSAIVNTIQERQYVNKVKGKLVPTDTGRSVNAYLLDKLPALFEVKFTANMEDELDNIESGGEGWQSMIGRFYERFQGWLDHAKYFALPEIDEMRTFLGIFHEDVEWAEPEKRGRRTYNDQRFYNSLKKSLDADKRLTDRQWEALLQLAVRYEEQLPTLKDVAAELELDEKVNELRTKIAEQKAAQDNQEPDEVANKLCACLKEVKEWEEPTQRGKRTYDDRKFYESLSEQVESGRRLSDAQRRALRNLVARYAEQIEQYDAVCGELDLPSREANADANAEAEALLALTSEIQNWPEPSGKGRRRFDEQEFVKSLARQYEQRRRLSERQLSSLKRVVAKHRDDIEDFDEKTKSLDLKGSDKTAKVTDVSCPQCNDAKLVERTFRSNTFFGCQKYPKCKYRTRSLEDLEAPST